MWPYKFKLIAIQVKFEIQYFGHTSYISSSQETIGLMATMLGSKYMGHFHCCWKFCGAALQALHTWFSPPGVTLEDLTPLSSPLPRAKFGLPAY